MAEARQGVPVVVLKGTFVGDLALQVPLDLVLQVVGGHLLDKAYRRVVLLSDNFVGDPA